MVTRSVSPVTGRDDARQTPLDVRCRLHGDELIVALRGTLDVDSADRLWKFLEPEATSGPANLILDLGHLRLIDSAGIGVLVKLRRALAARGAHLVVRRPRPVVAKLLDLTGVSHTVVIERAPGPGGDRETRTA
jgi:anti-anti-sigma factor